MKCYLQQAIRGGKSYQHPHLSLPSHFFIDGMKNQSQAFETVFIDITSPISLKSGKFSLRQYDKRNHSKTMVEYKSFPITCYCLMIICTKSRFVSLELIPDRSCKSFKIALSVFLETFKPKMCTIYCDRESSFLNLETQIQKTGKISQNSKKMTNSGKNYDQGFLSSPEFREISQRFKIKFKFTTGKDPLSNGYIEILNKSLKYSFQGF